jgi:hypothetical protein
LRKRLLPPWERAEVSERSGGLQNGGRGGESRRRPAVRWAAEHFDCIAGRQFCDKQLSGPFAKWLSTHRFLTSPIFKKRKMGEGRS